MPESLYETRAAKNFPPAESAPWRTAPPTLRRSPPSSARFAAKPRRPVGRGRDTLRKRQPRRSLRGCSLRAIVVQQLHHFVKRVGRNNVPANLRIHALRKFPPLLFRFLAHRVNLQTALLHRLHRFLIFPPRVRLELRTAIHRRFPHLVLLRRRQRVPAFLGDDQ